MGDIVVTGARIHNLRDVSARIPKNQIVAVTGVSGSGKSSFAFDTLAEEGRKRYLQALGFPDHSEQERHFDQITGLSPAVAVEQRTALYSNPRSTVGTRTGLYSLLRQLFILEGDSGQGLETGNLSFNEPAGWCPHCKGMGYVREFHERKIVPDPSRNLFQICEDGAFGGIKNLMPALAEAYGFDINTQYRDLPPEIRHVFLHGCDKKFQIQWNSERFSGVIESGFEGIIPHLHKTLAKTSSAYRISKIEREFMTRITCPACEGHRIGKKARSIMVNGKHIGELAAQPMGVLLDFLNRLDRDRFRTSEGLALRATLARRLEQSRLAGIAYLSLNRSMTTLSGGEVQRLNLMTHLSADLDSLLLVLDEPSQGLHELEKASLLTLLNELKARGNTVLVVDHDRKLIEHSDYIIDFGPGAGRLGGQVVYQGPVDSIADAAESVTGKYLAGELQVPGKAPGERRRLGTGTRYLSLRGASTNNLKNVEISIPLGMLVGIAGVSGCGKSSLISDTLVPLVREKMSKPEVVEGEEEVAVSEVSGRVDGSEGLSGCVVITQSPIGRMKTSNPASYIGIWDPIRRMFAEQGLAVERGYDAGHFSYNSDKGSCPRCGGTGTVEIELSFFDRAEVRCADCSGTGYRQEILEIKYRERNIREVLDLTVSEALQVFDGEPRLRRFLEILEELGMGYITLGQPATTLSGGEAQRIKLAKELGKSRKGHTLYVMDEPTAGLHDHDVSRLLAIMDRLADRGNSVIVIEHNLDVLSYMDYLIELGPGGGPDGGRIIATGTPEDLAASPGSVLGPFLKSRRLQPARNPK